MELFLIRHTKVNVNKGICYGFTDVDINDTFLEETKAIANELEGMQFDEIWSSPLSRCAKLAEYIFPNKTINYDKRLKELNFGDWEMTSWETISESQDGRSWMDDYVNKKCPNGESFNDQFLRIKEFFQVHSPTFTNKRIAIVAHGGSIRAFLSLLQNINLDKVFDISIDYGSITKIKVPSKS